ncbi:hypothetical protein BMS3Abin16_01152 [archaeon BMS3Abin16]|nr:hypothetical protein BMS3Abin16_01152 [archaeon BMS3Abin16]
MEGKLWRYSIVKNVGEKSLLRQNTVLNADMTTGAGGEKEAKYHNF